MISAAILLQTHFQPRMSEKWYLFSRNSVETEKIAKVFKFVKYLPFFSASFGAAVSLKL